MASPDDAKTLPSLGDPELAATAVTHRPEAPRPPERLGGDAAPGPLARGTMVGRYFVLQQIGEGGMGSVYSAYDPDLGRKVAIKLLKVGGEDAEEARAQLLKEAQAMARLSHPNVLPVFDAGAFGEALFVAMEFVDGTTLWSWLETKRPRREILRMFAQTGEGLAAAHEKGLVHRDFKPENVLVGRDGRPRVMDFGLAHVEGEAEPSVVKRQRSGSASAALTLAGQISGTPMYMAPEQFLGEATDARTDQFAFCVALWEALCGERPYAGEDFSALRQSVTAGNLRVSAKAIAAIPRRLRHALVRGLSRDPAARFERLEDLLRVLRRDARATARRVVPWALAALAVAGLVGSGLWARHQERTRCAREASASAAAAWSAGRRGELAATMKAAGVDPSAAEAVQAELSENFAAWTQAQTAACEQAKAAGRKQTLALACLEGQRVSAETATALLARRPKDFAGELGTLLERLDRPAECLERREPLARESTPELRRLRAEIVECALLQQVSRHAEVVERATELLAQARSLGALAEAAELKAILGFAKWRSQGPTPEIAPLLREAVREADAAGNDVLSLSNRLDLLNFLTLGAAQWTEAEQVSEDCAAWLARLGTPPRLEQLYLSMRGDLASELKRVDEAIALYQRSVVLAEKLYGERSMQLAVAHNSLATQYLRIGRHAEAARELEGTLQVYDKTRYFSPMNSAVAWTNLGCTQLYRGKLAEARAALERGLATLRPVLEQAEPYRVWNRVIFAEVLEVEGSRDEAAKAFAEGVARRDQLDPGTLCEALAGHARELARQGRADESLKVAREAVELSRKLAEPFSVGQARFAEAHALAAAGDRAGAIAAARGALESFAFPEDVYWRERIEAWIAGRK